MKNDDPVAALEIGTSRTVVAVGEPLEGGHVRVTARASIPSRGVRKSRIVDIQQVSRSVESVLNALEREQDYAIGRAYLAVTGPHIRTKRLVTPWELGGKTVEDADLEAVYNQSCELGLKESERTLLDVSELGYSLDDLERVASPKGMSGRLLSLHTLAVHGSTDRIADAKAAAARCKLEIADSYYAASCAASAVLTREMQRAGALVVDLGGGSTSCCAYVDGHLAWTQVIGVGGDHVTDDIRHAFNLTTGQAEKLKVASASATLGGADASEDARVEIAASPGFSPISVSRNALDTVTNARMSELFSIILELVDAENLLHRLGGGVVFTGGGAALRGVTELAASIFGKRCAVGRLVEEIEGLENDPFPAAWASVAGLLLKASSLGVPATVFKTVSDFMKGFFRK